MLTGGGSPGPSRVLALLLLLTVVLSAAAPRVLETVQSRVLRESQAAALGLPRRQARTVVLLESLPLLIVAVTGGLLAALALPAAVGSALNLGVFIGSGGAQPVQLGLLPLALAAGGTALLVILTAAGQAGAAMRGSAATALRKGED